MRLATRRAEQKLRLQEHQINMEMMKQRVRAAPLLLEGDTKWELPHSCRYDPHKSCSKRNNQRLLYNTSKLSQYSDAKSYCDFES